MKEQIDELKNKFLTVKNKGWIVAESKGYGSIGLTFEKMLDIPQNEFEIPDFEGIEIKTKTIGSDSYTTLFNCVPTGPGYHEVERIKDTYGYPDSILKSFRVLNAIIKGNYLEKVSNRFWFTLRVDKKKEKVFLTIYDIKKSIIENNVYWDFDILKEKLERKLKYLAIIKAKKKIAAGEKFFKYTDISFYKLKGFDAFIDQLQQGCITISLKLGIFRYGNRKGKIHDRGVGFGIKEENLFKIFDEIK